MEATISFPSADMATQVQEAQGTLLKTPVFPESVDVQIPPLPLMVIKNLKTTFWRTIKNCRIMCCNY